MKSQRGSDPGGAVEAMASIDASVIVCTYNRAASLEAMLASLRASVVNRELGWELLVVDNNSSDGTRAVVERMAPDFPCPVRLLSEPRQGKSYALNRAIGEARGELLLFTDDDVVVHPGWVQAMVTGFAVHDCMGIGGRIEAVWEQEKPAWYGNTGPYRLFGAIIEYDFGAEAGDVTSPPFGANMAFRRQAFRRYGRFREDLGPSGGEGIIGEDSDFCRRLLGGGDRVLYLPSAVIYHPVEAKRATRRYFTRWYYNYGRTLVRLDPDGIRQSITYFGVPRHLVRTLAENGWRWLTTFGSRRRFYYKLQCCLGLGQIAESSRRRLVAGGPEGEEPDPTLAETTLSG